jgi:hypothetical protein
MNKFIVRIEWIDYVPTEFEKFTKWDLSRLHNHIVKKFDPEGTKTKSISTSRAPVQTVRAKR